MDLVKSFGATATASPRGAAPAGGARSAAASDGPTRHSVARLLLEQGPVSAARIAEELGMTTAAVRRHLDALLTDGEACEHATPRRGQRGRGRPARHFTLTAVGRARFGHAYDDLAVSALRFLAESGGAEAVRAFARQRVESLVGRHRGSMYEATGQAERTTALATLLSREGYAASTHTVASGEQICQHHCPVAHVASEFPQLCEAETAAFAELLGTHVQRLATIARGDAVCTTHVPRDVRGRPRGAAMPRGSAPGNAGNPSGTGPSGTVPESNTTDNTRHGGTSE
jgi:predicted ArsR family transcriptional regulator